MDINFASSRRSSATKAPDIVALVTHLMRYSGSRHLILWGDWGQNSFLESSKGQYTVTVLGDCDTGDEIFSLFERQEQGSCLLLARDGFSRSKDSTLLSAVSRFCTYSVVAGSASLGQTLEPSCGISLESSRWRLLFSGTVLRSDDVREPVNVFYQKAFMVEAPPDFAVVAIIAAYNEIDIVAHSIAHLLQQQVGVYFIDNWSTDGTFELVRKQFGDRLVGVERFPANATSSTFDLYALLKRKEQLAQSINAAWIIHQDADEFRYSPFAGRSLRDGLFVVDQSGYNAVNHTVLEFPPTGNLKRLHDNPEAMLTQFRFGRQASDLVQVKAWKKTHRLVSLADNAGHHVKFEGKRIYPFNFLLKHYPIRSQEQGQRKVFLERIPRYSQEGKQRGWHVQYSKLCSDHSFAEDRSDLESFDLHDFDNRFLVQRLTGCGIG